MQNALATRAGLNARISAKAAEYMELSGAVKDADCKKVNVPGGVSKKLGCCDRFQPENKAVQEFRCGTCEYVINAKIS